MIDVDFICYVYSIVNQFFFVLKCDFYEDVDGESVCLDSELSFEQFLLCFGVVRMYRKVNILDENEVLIKNNFNCFDFVNVLFEVDLDIIYFDLMFINKINGMVIESCVYLLEQFNFGELIGSKSGFDVIIMNVIFLSNIVFIEVNFRVGGYYVYEEFVVVDIDVFVKFFLVQFDGYFVINEK